MGWKAGFGLSLSLLAMAAAGARAEIRTCTDGEVKAADSIGLSGDEDHALFAVPQITYAHPQTSTLGLSLQFIVGEEGQIVCLRDAKDSIVYNWLEETPQRRSLIPMMDTWRFKPFLVGDQAVRALVEVNIPEKIDFHFHEDMPAGPASEAIIKLTRSGCYGSCPGYSVVLHGSGWVDFDGEWYTAIHGKHLYTVDPATVAALVERFRKKDIWSMAGNWVTLGFDAPRYAMDITVGGEHRHFEDFFGDQLGMPPALADAMDDVDATSQADGFIHLSLKAVSQLEAEGFNFKSQKGADLFYQAVNDDRAHDDAATLRLMDLGVSVTSGRVNKEEMYQSKDTALDAVLRHHRTLLVEPLIAKGVLLTAGQPDQSKIDSAFDAAISGGRLAVVQLMWDQAGTRPHPSLAFNDGDEDGKAVRLPVTLLLQREDGDSEWEGLAIAQWLIAQGCDLKTIGPNERSLLSIAVEADDIAMAKYLLSQGMDPNNGKYNDPVLGSVENDEDMAMLLIDAGTNPWSLETKTYSFVNFAKGNGWTRVLAWMEAHKPVDKKD